MSVFRAILTIIQGGLTFFHLLDSEQRTLLGTSATLLGTSASLLVTSALLVVTKRIYIIRIVITSKGIY